ncbi:MAG: putative Ig domain-containing protein, partial [Chloroflexota bacterium]
MKKTNSILLLWQMRLSAAKGKPWLASQLLRQLKMARQQTRDYLLAVCIKLGLVNPRKVLKRLKKATGAVVAGGGMAVLLNLTLVNADALTVTTLTDILNNGDGQCELREAIINANNDDQSGSAECPAGDGFDIITLPSGTITLAQTGTDEDGSLMGDLDVITGTQLLIQGQGITQTIIDANQLDRVFHLFSEAQLTLSDLTIMNGRVNTNGGGILNHNGQLILNNVHILANQSTAGRGGGIFNHILSSTAQLTLTNSAILSNTALNQGGGIYSYVNSGGNLTLDIQNSIISGNVSTDSSGGGVYSASYKGTLNLSITDSTVRNNQAKFRGGGIALDAPELSTANLNIRQSIISGNTSTDSQGGGIAVTNSYSGDTLNLTITDSTVSGNRARHQGGGIHAYARQGTTTLDIRNSIISGNVSTDLSGGGVYSASYEGILNLSLTDSTINANVAKLSGGGISFAPYEGKGNLDIHNSVISGNVSTDSNGGGISSSVFDDLLNIMITDSEISTNRSKSQGGGLSLDTSYTSIANLDIRNSVISGNASTNSKGGGINIKNQYRDTLNLTIIDSIITANRASLEGGGLATEAGTYAIANLDIQNSVISGNVSSDSDGGGIYHGAEGTGSKVYFSLTDGIIQNNIAQSGAGISANADAESIVGTDIVSSTIAGNTATNGPGGGLLNKTGSDATSSAVATLTIVNSAIRGNTATDGGGGIYNFAQHENSDAFLSIVESVLNHNMTTGNGPGGGISNVAKYGQAQVVVRNSTLSGNQSNTDGGGIFSNTEVPTATATIILTHTTIINNFADFDANDSGDGGGLHVEQAQAVHSLIAENEDNSPSSTVHPDVSGTVTGDAYNLISQTQGGSGTLGTGSDIVAASQASPLGNHDEQPTLSGEPPYTHALFPNSPAIDAIPNADCLLSIDQRGIDRPQLTGCDIGAFESQGFYLRLDGGDSQSTLINTPFDTPLQLTYLATDTNLLLGAGHTLNFTAPSSGASLAPPLFTASTNNVGVISVAITANNEVGDYQVLATSPGERENAIFNLSNYANPDANDCGPLNQEAEAAILSGDFVAVNDGSASNGQFIEVPNGQGSGGGTINGNIHQAEFCFTITDGGTYRLVGSVWGRTGGSNSFWVTVDGQPANGYKWKLPINTGFSDRVLSDGGEVQLSLEPGDHTVILYLRENGSRIDTIRLEQIGGIGPNETPVLDPISDQVVTEGSLINFTATASDNEGDVLTFSLSNAPAGATIGANDGFFNWQTDEADGPGSYNATVSVSDGTSTDSQIVSLTVDEVNIAPILDTIPNQTVSAGNNVSFTATASDSDIPAQSLTYSLSNAPSGATIDASSGLFTWSDSPVGSHNVTVIVSDGVLSDSQVVQIT